MEEQKEAAPRSSKSFIAPSRKLEFSAPLRWLRLGWQDYTASLRLSIEYGAFFALGGLLLTVIVFLSSGSMTLLSLGVLFILLGPLFAFGLYDISRQLQKGEPPTLIHSIHQIRNSAANQWVFAVVVIVIGLIWMRAATMIHIFYPDDAEPALEELLTFLAIGSGVGLFFASLVFGISAFSLPMMVDRNVDAITAALSSLNAVMSNKWVAAFWALLILLLVVIGFATLYLGLIVVLPVIGYATWHGYRDTILP
jgi:uncharacterized membrane protein